VIDINNWTAILTSAFRKVAVGAVYDPLQIRVNHTKTFRMRGRTTSQNCKKESSCSPITLWITAKLDKLTSIDRRTIRTTATLQSDRRRINANTTAPIWGTFDKRTVGDIHEGISRNINGTPIICDPRRRCFDNPPEKWSCHDVTGLYVGFINLWVLVRLCRAPWQGEKEEKNHSWFWQ
jgi:hypothetical protein